MPISENHFFFLDKVMPLKGLREGAFCEIYMQQKGTERPSKKGWGRCQRLMVKGTETAAKMGLGVGVRD